MKIIRFYHFVPAVLFFGITFYLFTLPGEKIPEIQWADKIKLDKIVHLGLFTILIGLFAYPFNKSTVAKKQRLNWFFLFSITGVVYGISIEFIQKYFIPNRSFDLFDIVADTIGCIVGYIVAKWLFKK